MTLNTSLISSIKQKQQRFSNLLQDQKTLESNIVTTDAQMKQILAQQDLLERCLVALNQAKPLLSASSITQCESLANSAISSIFNRSDTVSWDAESQRFLLNKDGSVVDLAESSGGGLATVVSFVFTVYLLHKLSRRHLMLWDEHFSQISQEYLPAFMEFARKLCADLHVDILLVTHDARITEDMVDHIYAIDRGHSLKVK